MRTRNSMFVGEGSGIMKSMGRPVITLFAWKS
jgi:hypothetical protein